MFSKSKHAPVERVATAPVDLENNSLISSFERERQRKQEIAKATRTLVEQRHQEGSRFNASDALQVARMNTLDSVSFHKEMDTHTLDEVEAVIQRAAATGQSSVIYDAKRFLSQPVIDELVELGFVVRNYGKRSDCLYAIHWNVAGGADLT